MAGSTHHQLVLLPLRFVTAAQALDVVERLRATRSIEIVDLVRVSHRSTDRIEVTRTGPPCGTPIPLDGWRWLVAAAFGVTAPDADRPQLSASFVAELRELRPLTPEWLALLTSRLDPGAAVSALAPYPATRLVYGSLTAATIDALHARGSPSGGATDATA